MIISRDVVVARRRTSRSDKAARNCSPFRGRRTARVSAAEEPDKRFSPDPPSLPACRCIPESPPAETHGMEAEHRLEQLKRATDRIQREIEEVTEREHELRNVGSIKTTSHETVDFKVRRMPQALSSGKLKRTTSTPQILEAVSPTSLSPNLTPKMTNGVISTRTTPTPLRFATIPSQKGLMHRFLATRGKLYKNNSPNDDSLNSPITPVITLNPLSIKAFNRTLEIPLEPDDTDGPQKPLTRKGYVPVEQKIQKELHDMKERENELRLMRSQMLAKSQPNLLDIGNDNDSDIYDGSSSLRSGTSTNTLNEDEIEREHKGKHKPNPRRRNTLIAQWENLIAAKREAIENNNEKDNYF
ncbi:PREDICTED: uncharacterized protein LOC108772536 [Cyphomyrmex costatus]|uniref:uncharacterized protein LOC108772536 n=1 Tax=Cyphomyrmex costatus TaxID=456900 RepID=UPI0008522849|nr:PREDICTED: uncharacterized protein LOC108772536 [Cyphomyrmex costatus]XP_018393579.1 PREDICTED: uncharacterized protein LOC108772536 [Cyphomyrmex costatus]